MNNYNIVYSDSLYHHGIKGQRWGVRRYQNDDGSLTTAGKMRYKTDENGNVVRKSAHEKRQEQKESKSYNYKTSERYTNANRYEKASITSVYNTRKRLLGEKKANRIEYRHDKYGTDSNKDTKKAMIKAAVLGTVAITALVNAGTIASIGKHYISKAKNSVMMNNLMVDLYSYKKGGLNVIDKPGITLGFDAVKKGQAMAKKILGVA